MGFRISPLESSEFSHLFGADEDTLAKHNIVRMEVLDKPGYPCRVSLAEAEVGESVLLLNYEHLALATPYRSAHAIFVRENAESSAPFDNDVPESLRIRQLSLRAFDDAGMMVDADVIEGEEIESAIDRMFSDEAVVYLHAHNAKRGCYAARIDRLD